MTPTYDEPVRLDSVALLTRARGALGRRGWLAHGRHAPCDYFARGLKTRKLRVATRALLVGKGVLTTVDRRETGARISDWEKPDDRGRARRVVVSCDQPPARASAAFA